MLLWWSCRPLVTHSCGLLNHLNSFLRNVQAWCSIQCRSVVLLTQSFWMRQPHSAHTHLRALPAPLATTVKSSLFVHVHSSPLSLAAKLHRCIANCFYYIHNGLTFPDRTHICNPIKWVYFPLKYKRIIIFRNRLVVKLDIHQWINLCISHKKNSFQTEVTYQTSAQACTPAHTFIRMVTNQF